MDSNDQGWIAALPIYDFPKLAAAHDALWSAVAARERLFLDALNIEPDESCRDVLKLERLILFHQVPPGPAPPARECAAPAEDAAHRASHRRGSRPRHRDV